MSIDKSIRNGLLAAPHLNNYRGNAISGASPKSTHWSKESAVMYETIGPYASNVFEAEIQGLDYDNFYEWKKVKLRSSNIIDASTGDALEAAWQKIMILDRHIDFIPLGAYVKYNRATWIVTNTDSAAMDNPSAIIMRCNTTYNVWGENGEIVKVPYVLTNGKVLAASGYYTAHMVEIDGYAHLVIQKNKYTEKWTNSSRLIIGKSAYNIYGLVDSMMEFTDIEGSTHLIKADLRLSEVLPNDDMVNGIADGDNHPRAAWSQLDSNGFSRYM